MGAVTRSAASLPTSVAVGSLATLSMDAVFLAAARLGGDAFTSDRVGLELVGRWAGGLARGRLRHADIAAEPAARHEAALGLAVHYATGIALAHVYRMALPRAGRRAGLPSATGFGAATALLPLLVMYPSWGIGPMGLRSGEARRLGRLMLIGHSAFGLAIGFWDAVLPASQAQHTAGAGRAQQT